MTYLILNIIMEYRTCIIMKDHLFTIKQRVELTINLKSQVEPTIILKQQVKPPIILVEPPIIVVKPPIILVELTIIPKQQVELTIISQLPFN